MRRRRLRVRWRAAAVAGGCGRRAVGDNVARHDTAPARTHAYTHFRLSIGLVGPGAATFMHDRDETVALRRSPRSHGILTSCTSSPVDIPPMSMETMQGPCALSALLISAQQSGTFVGLNAGHDRSMYESSTKYGTRFARNGVAKSMIQDAIRILNYHIYLQGEDYVPATIAACETMKGNGCDDCKATPSGQTPVRCLRAKKAIIARTEQGSSWIDGLFNVFLLKGAAKDSRIDWSLDAFHGNRNCEDPRVSRWHILICRPNSQSRDDGHFKVETGNVG
ncbi:hypothetical protein HYFRA_00013926 [Hymenoscyphus fraxineus]|uniref:Uncharacterized protein n=1 Tax=Hymenoscyphus fraxineus TaxID=746836 RepID=A0A9N9PP09_9HELO|nr:hypothetical protein HYFRA_00013926 [Hymenoscyphus fraxineus]